MKMDEPPIDLDRKVNASTSIDFEREPERRFNPWSLVLYVAILAAFAVAGAYLGHMIANLKILDIEEAVTNYQQNVTTRVLDVGGERTLGELAEERRVLIGFEQIPESFIDALIVAEDKDFLQHHGVDLISIVRAFWANLSSGRVVQGGSTISQQLIKNLFLSPEQTYTRKIKEAVLALQLEAKYTKEEILGFYCNTVYFGHQRYGLEAASRFYFGKSAQDLDLPESALLAAIVRAPERYTPYRHLERAMSRRNFVLERMANLGYIKESESEIAKAEGVVLRERVRSDQLGPYFVEEIRKFLVQNYGREEAYGGGLTIYSTLDPQMQVAAESALREGLYELSMRQPLRPVADNVVDDGGDPETFHLREWDQPILVGDYIHAVITEVGKQDATLRIGEAAVKVTTRNIHTRMLTREQRADLQKVFRPGDVLPVLVDKLDSEGRAASVRLTQEPETEAALVAIEVETGRVLAMVGGFDFEISQYNCAMQARRQTGSAFKPIVLATALEQNKVTLGSTFFDEPTVFDDPRDPELYEPDNYKHEYIGITTVRDLIEKSRNIPAIKLMVHTGIEDTIVTAKKMGVEPQLPPFYSLALGSIEMSLLNLAGVFSVFPNQGVVVEPYLIERIEGRDGRVLFEHVRRPQTAISRTTAFLVTQALMGVVRRGTGKSALPLVEKLGVPLAGKTGTTDDYTDAWFVGFSPQVVCGVWVGYSEQKITIGDDESGARAALPIWRRFMERALAEERWRQIREYSLPPNVVAVQIDRRNGLLVGSFTPEEERIFEFFVRGTEPRRSTTYDDDYNLRIGSIRLMEKRVDVSFEDHRIVKPRWPVETWQ